MKIAVLTNDYPPATHGGAGIIAEIYVQGLERLGHEVKVFHHASMFLSSSVFLRLFHHLKDLRPRVKLVEQILEWKPDVLLSHNLTGCGFGTPRRVKREGVRWVHVLHDVQLVDPSGRIMMNGRFEWVHLPWRWFWSFTRRVALGSPNVVISPTRWLLLFHRAHGFFRSSATDVLPNPLALDSMEETTERERAILYVGRVDRDKGIDVLLSAWQAMGEDRPRLHVVGEGERKFGLSALGDGRLTIHGHLSRERIRTLMARVRVLAVPSLLIENQPTSALEGLALGCHVVGSDVGGIPETLNGAGWIVPVGKIDALTGALQEAIDAGPDATREAKRRETLELHRPTAVVEALASLLTSKR
ncbi:MAG: glycosyltransferase [Patescibacteria group bacterium]|jgi:glycosyltransferase involved in cell wall biosynthesis